MLYSLSNPFSSNSPSYTSSSSSPFPHLCPLELICHPMPSSHHTTPPPITVSSFIKQRSIVPSLCCCTDHPARPPALLSLVTLITPLSTLPAPLFSPPVWVRYGPDLQPRSGVRLEKFDLHLHASGVEC